jgi:hypothetical protein
MPESGTTHRGYRVQGTSDIQGAANNTAAKKCLVIGGGAFQARQLLNTPPVAQSGFTLGFWVSPQSDGYIKHQGGSLETLARTNAIFTKGATNDALYIGVSGARHQGAQFGQDITASGLQAFAVVISASAPGVKVDTPIESGAYTHITMSYRFTAANSAAVALYKNGRLAASGTNAGNQMSATNAQFNDRPLTIGGSIIGNAAGVDRYEDACGFGHLISGVYAYDRVLDEGEILQLHNKGGLQVDPTLVYPLYQEVSITDPSIVSYIPFISPGFIDASRHHLNLFSNQDECSISNYMNCPGPFGRAMAFNDTANTIDIAIASPSGTLIELLYGGNGSFTIGGWFAMDSAAGVTSTTYDTTTLFSLGSIGSTGEFLPARQTGGFQVSASGATNNVRISARLYDGGLVTVVNTKVLMHPEVDLFLSMFRHVALVYDEQTFGISLYVDGMLAQSGAMPNSMLAQMRRLAGSGYPLVFLNGVPGETTDVFSNNAGDDCAVGEIFIANRPLLPAEIKYVAESGIRDISKLYYSVNDPRLRGYWDCTGSGTNDMVVQDSCLIFSSGGIPGHLTQIVGDPLWDLVQTSFNRTQLARIDRVSQSRHPDRGITSGSWSVMSSSDGIPHTSSTTGEWSRTSSTDYCQRYKMCVDERDVRAPTHINEWVIGFNVTPSGIIPPNPLGIAGRETNASLLYLGEPSATDSVHSFLTTDQASGLLIVFQSTDGTTLVTNLASGVISFGVQSRVMFHAKPLLPYNNDTVTPIEITLYMNGNPIQRNILASNAASTPAARLYDVDANGATDNWTMQIGGRAAQDTFSSQSTAQDGLGQIYMNGIFIMVGSFSANDLLTLAASGIDSSKTITNYPNSLNTFPVTISDDTLQGYWRFSGPDAGSGITDLSAKANDLNAVARSIGAGVNSAFLLRYLPLGFVNASIPVQASGITYVAGALGIASPPPFAISGTMFQIPQSGFSVGFWIAPRESVAASDAVVPLSYGIVPSSTTSIVFTDSSWAIEIDEDNNIVMILSQDGKMRLGNAATSSASQTKCPILRSPVGDIGPDIEVFRRGYFNPGHIDALEHIAFTFNHSPNGGVSGIVKGYLNGEKVAEATVPASGFHQPLAQETRFISFMIPQTGIWTFGTARGALNSIMSDVFYFSRPLGDEEVRYIALNGIGSPSTTTVSGAIGGYIQGLAGADGEIGGYIVGTDTASGVIGGYMPGAFASSGTIGGYISALYAPSGAIGGYISANIGASGTIGGYISSKVVCSGAIGGWERGAIRGVLYFDAMFTVEFFATADFDAKFRVDQTNSADFDAKLVVFQAEQPPDIAIIVPSSTLSGEYVPWNQYFIGSGRAVQGKSIVQAKFSFSDFTMPVLVSESGNDLYPVEHVFSQSGLYVVRFSVIDSNGQHSSATRIIDLASGVAPVNIALSGFPTAGVAPLSVAFNQVVISVPDNVAIIAQLLSFDDGQESIINNPNHIYTEPGQYRPIWVIRDSRGVIWSDSLVAGVNN